MGVDNMDGVFCRMVVVLGNLELMYVMLFDENFSMSIFFFDIRL